VQFQAGLSCDEGGRSRTCSDTCTYGSFGACYVPATDQVTASGTVGGKASGEFTLDQNTVTGRLRYTCGDDAEVGSSETPYHYIKVVNPTASTLTVSVWTSESDQAGAPSLDTVMASYGATQPTDEASRLQCVTGVDDDCYDDSEDTGCLGGWAGLFDDDEVVTIPAGSSAFIYVAGYSEDDYGAFKLNVRTDAVH
jgi:hypothetical protein